MLVWLFQRGYCPDLELLEVNTKLDSKGCELAVCIQALQRACPKLKVKSPSTNLMLQLQDKIHDEYELTLLHPAVQFVMLLGSSFSVILHLILFNL